MHIKLCKLYKLTSISTGVLVVFQVSVVCVKSPLAACPLFSQLHPNLKRVVYKDIKFASTL